MSRIPNCFRYFLILYLCTELIISSAAPKPPKFEVVKSEASNPFYRLATQLREQSFNTKKRRKGKKKRKELDESSFMAMMGNDFMTEWMALENPYKTKASEYFDDFHVPRQWGKHELIRDMKKVNLTKELIELAPGLLHQESQIRQYLLKRSSCPTNFTWYDLGHTFWPRWIRKGECESRSGHCSFPTGMNCVPNTSMTVHVLNWVCKERKERKSRTPTDTSWVETIVEYRQSVTPNEGEKQHTDKNGGKKGKKGKKKDKNGKKKDKKGKKKGKKEKKKGKKGKNKNKRENIDTNEVKEIVKKRAKRRVMPLRLWGSLFHRKPVPRIKETKNKKKCNWKKVPYTITIDCFCGC